MHLIDHTKSLLENLYYISGILILLSILVGLVQLILTKKTIIINSKREAAMLAAGQIEIYLTRVMPFQTTLFLAETKNGIERLTIEMGTFNRQAIIKKLGKEKVSDEFKKRMPVLSDTLNVMNSLEAFSVYFIKKVADEEIAFSAVGGTFIFAVENLYFDIAYCIIDEDDQSFQNTISLYGIWSKRNLKLKLQRQQQKLYKKINSIEVQKIRPIGTK